MDLEFPHFTLPIGIEFFYQLPNYLSKTSAIKHPQYIFLVFCFSSLASALYATGVGGELIEPLKNPKISKSSNTSKTLDLGSSNSYLNGTILGFLKKFTNSALFWP